jgi:hypothetical protein
MILKRLASELLCSVETFNPDILVHLSMSTCTFVGGEYNFFLWGKVASQARLIYSKDQALLAPCHGFFHLNNYYTVPFAMMFFFVSLTNYFIHSSISFPQDIKILHSTRSISTINSFIHNMHNVALS